MFEKDSVESFAPWRMTFRYFSMWSWLLMIDQVQKYVQYSKCVFIFMQICTSQYKIGVDSNFTLNLLWMHEFDLSLNSQSKIGGFINV